MEHPDITRTLRTGYPEPQKRLEHKPGDFWDPVEWMQEKERLCRKKNSKEVKNHDKPIIKRPQSPRQASEGSRAK